MPAWLRRKPVQDSEILERTTRWFRLLGWLMLIFGLFVFRHYLAVNLDPRATIVFGHAVTSDPTTKHCALLVSGSFVLFGATCALIPYRMMRRILRFHLEFTRNFIRRAKGLPR